MHLVEKLCSFYHLDIHRHPRERAGMGECGGSAVGARYIVRGREDATQNVFNIKRAQGCCPWSPPQEGARGQNSSINQSINLLLFLQKQNLATAIYLFGLGTLLTGLGLKHMRICSHHDLVGALVTSLFLGRPWWSTTSPTCLPLSVFTITSDQHRCRIPPLL